MSSSDPVEPGDHPERVGPYLIDRVLGRGAFGVVYLACQETRDAEPAVALKVLHRADPETVGRLDAETRALEALVDQGSFPSFPRVIARAHDHDQHYLAMDYVAGGPIDAFCDERRLDLDGRVRLFIRACLAVQKAHQRSILHRDLKPAHILIKENGGPTGEPAAHIIDFGLARGLQRVLVSNLFTRGARLGTPGYASPEQWAGEDVDFRSDVYSLGVVLYWLLAGCLPRDPNTDPQAAHQADELLPSPAARFAQLLANEPERAAEIATRRSTKAPVLHRRLRGPLGDIAATAIAPAPDRRYQDAGELAADLTCYLSDKPIRGKPPGRGYALWLSFRRNRAAIGIYCGLIVTVTAAFALLGQRLAHAKERVQDSQRRLELVAAEQRAVAKELFRSGQMAAQRGRWHEALGFYQQAERAGYEDSLELGIRRVEALDACYACQEARDLLASLWLREDSGRRKASLLLLEADIGARRFDDPDAGLDAARAALQADTDVPGSLSPVEREYAEALLATKPRDALEHLRRARVHDASDHRVNQSYALTLLLLGEKEEATQFAALFQALNPDDEESHYLSVVMSGLGGRGVDVDQRVASIEKKFGREAAEVAREIAAVMELPAWADQQLRRIVTRHEPDLPLVFSTLAVVFGKLNRLRGIVAARSEGRGAAGFGSALERVPPSLARVYHRIARAWSNRFEPKALGRAFEHLERGQVDGLMLMVNAFASVFDKQLVEACLRLDDALNTPSFLCSRRTLLMLGIAMGAATLVTTDLSPDSEQRRQLQALVQGWLEEAAALPDLESAEMRVVFGAARAIGQVKTLVTIAHRWYAKAPTEPRARLARIEALALDGALNRAEELLRELETDPEATRDGSLDLATIADTRQRLAKLRR